MCVSGQQASHQPTSGALARLMVTKGALKATDLASLAPTCSGQDQHRERERADTASFER